MSRWLVVRPDRTVRCHSEEAAALAVQGSPGVARVIRLDVVAGGGGGAHGNARPAAPEGARPWWASSSVPWGADHRAGRPTIGVNAAGLLDGRK